METIILKCLQKEVKDRYVAARDLSVDLQSFLAGRAILARRTPYAIRFWRRCRRSRLLTTLMLGIILLGGLLITQTATHFTEASRLQEEIRTQNKELVKSVVRLNGALSQSDKLRRQAEAQSSEIEIFC